MAIEQKRTVEVLAVEVADDYSVDLTARDILTGDEVVVSLSWEEAYEHANEVLAKIAEAQQAHEEDEVAKAQQRPRVNGFDRDLLVCRDCHEGKHGACNGTAQVLTSNDSVTESPCRCTADGHRGRS